jgi:hypothetical protein
MGTTGRSADTWSKIAAAIGRLSGGEIRGQNPRSTVKSLRSMSKFKKRAAEVNRFKSGCWVDLYSRTYFAGKLTRIYGPGPIRIARIGSLIVGPEALLIAAERKRGVSLRALRPRQIIADLNAHGWKVKLGVIKGRP